MKTAKLSHSPLRGEFASLGGLVGVLAGCPADDGGSNDTGTVSMSSTMSTTMTTADTEPATSTMGETEEGSSSGSMVECPDDTISFAADIQPILDASCITDCHVTGGEWPTLLLEDAYDIIVDEESLQTQTVDDLVLIAPNDVANSYIVHKLRGTHDEVVDPALALQAMPSEIVTCDPMTDKECRDDGTKLVEGTPLPEAQIQLIEDWINCGAPE